ncbi:hypothetical protein WCLP8_480002 [uncultured Gammaproteobacteria bacterium]
MESYAILDYAYLKPEEPHADLLNAEILEGNLHNLFKFVDRTPVGRPRRDVHPKRHVAVYLLSDLQTKEQFMNTIENNLVIEVGGLTHLDLSLPEACASIWFSPDNEYWRWSKTFQGFHLVKLGA